MAHQVFFINVGTNFNLPGTSECFARPAKRLPVERNRIDQEVELSRSPADQRQKSFSHFNRRIAIKKI